MVATWPEPVERVSSFLRDSWFGDMITCANWSHIWLNEGFATYAVALYAEERYGVPAYSVDICHPVF